MKRFLRETLIFFSFVMNILLFLETFCNQAASGLEFTAGSQQLINKTGENQILTHSPKTHTVWFEREMNTFIITANT